MGRNAILLAAAVAALAWGPGASAQGGGWAVRRLPWYGLPLRNLIGAAPTSLAMPPAAGACGAISDRLEPFAAHGEVFVRVAVRAESGAVSIAMRSADGSDALSKTKTVTPAQGMVSVFFRVDPGDSPRAIVLCQASPSSEDSRADVESVNVAFAAALAADEAAKANVGAL
jgi:hypothetical protein